MMKYELLALNQKAQVEMTVGNFSIHGLDDLKQAIEKEIEKYNGLVIAYKDKQSIREGKNVRASLNAIAKQIDDYRKIYKAEYLKPLNTFETELNVLRDMVMNGANAIKLMLDDVEEQRKKDKRQHVEDMVNELCEGYSIPFSDKWLNATASDLDIRKQIIELVEQEKKKKEDYDNQVKLIKSFAELYQQQSDGWIAQLDYNTVTEIQQRMKASYEAEKEKQRKHDELEHKNTKVLQTDEKIVSVTPKEEKTESEKYADFLFSDFYMEEVEQSYTLTITTTPTKWEHLKTILTDNAITFAFVEEKEVDKDDINLPW